MKEALINYFNENKVEEDLMMYIKESIAKIINKNSDYKKTLIGLCGNYESIINEMTNEIFIKLKKKREILEEQIEMGGKIEGYIYILIKNYIVDVVKMRKISISLNETDNEGNERIEYVTVSDDYDDPKLEVIARMFYEELKENFDKEKLCYFLYKMAYKEEEFLIDKSKDAKYKIVQRTKEKLRKFVEENGISEKEFEMTIKIYMSEICEKIRNNSGSKKLDCEWEWGIWVF